MSVRSMSFKEKAQLEVSLSLGPQGTQVNTLRKIDLRAETNILLKSLYQQFHPGRMNLAQPTLRLSAYGGTEISNLGSCHIYVRGPNNPVPKPIQAQVMDIESLSVIGKMSAQNPNLLKLKWSITANRCSDLSSHNGTHTPIKWSRIRSPRKICIQLSYSTRGANSTHSHWQGTIGWGNMKTSLQELAASQVRHTTLISTQNSLQCSMRRNRLQYSYNKPTLKS